MRQNIICHTISEQELSFPLDASRWIIHPTSFLVGKMQEICQPPANNTTLNFLSHNTSQQRWMSRIHEQISVSRAAQTHLTLLTD